MNKSVLAFAIGFIGTTLIIVGCIMFPEYDIYLGGLAFILLSAVGIYMLINHRCPKCRALLMSGNTFMLGVKFCPSCGADLKEFNRK